MVNLKRDLESADAILTETARLLQGQYCILIPSVPAVSASRCCFINTLNELSDHF